MKHQLILFVDIVYRAKTLPFCGRKLRRVKRCLSASVN